MISLIRFRDITNSSLLSGIKKSSFIFQNAFPKKKHSGLSLQGAEQMHYYQSKKTGNDQEPHISDTLVIANAIITCAQAGLSMHNLHVLK